MGNVVPTLINYESRIEKDPRRRRNMDRFVKETEKETGKGTETERDPKRKRNMDGYGERGRKRDRDRDRDRGRP